MMSLMLCFSISMPVILLMRRAVDTMWTTSWGPCTALNFLVGAKKLRYYSPQEQTSGRRLSSSVHAKDKRVATGAVIVLSSCELGKMIHNVFRAMGVPWGFGCQLSFLLCEARKYFGENVSLWRRRFHSQASRDQFEAVLKKTFPTRSINIGSFLKVDGEDCFITPSDDESDSEASDSDEKRF